MNQKILFMCQMNKKDSTFTFMRSFAQNNDYKNVSMLV